MKDLLTLFILAFGAISALAQSFEASVNKTTVGTDEQIRLSFNITNGTPKEFSPPPLNDFYILSGPSTSQSSNISIINGKMTQNTNYSYEYFLQPKKEGQFRIDPASIKIDGKTYTSDPINIKVVKGSSTSGSDQNTGGNGSLSDNIMFKAYADKTEVYQGEPLTVTYKLYYAINLRDLTLPSAPTYNGFWSQDIDVKRNREEYENINGKRYATTTVIKKLLIPQKSGNLSLNKLNLEMVARVPSGRNHPFWGPMTRDVRYVASSNPLNIKVKPLPSGQPANFTGGVGNFSFEARLDNDQIKTNGSVDLSIKIKGSGNLKFMQIPKPDIPSEIEVYDPRTSDNISVSSNGMSGTRSVEYLMVPRHQGEYRIKPLQFSYFDLQKKKYITLTSPEFVLKVKGEGKPTPKTPNLSGVNKEDVELLGKDILFIKTDAPEFRKKEDPFLGSGTFFFLLSLPFLIFGGAYFARQKQVALQSDAVLMKNKKASKIARKRLSFAHQYLNSNEKEAFYEEISRALWGYLSDKLNIPTSSLTKERVRSSLHERKVDEVVFNQLFNIIDTCEFARYAPSSDGKSLQDIYNQSAEVISELESDLKSQKS